MMSKDGFGSRDTEVSTSEEYGKDPSRSFHLACRSTVSPSPTRGPTNKPVEYIGGVSQDVALDAVRECQEIQLEIKDRSRGLFNNDEDHDTLGLFALEEIVFDKTPLGSGGFSHVYEIKRFELKSDQDQHITNTEKKARSFIAQHAKRETTGEKRYVMKHLKPELMQDHSKFITGATDIALEAELLSMLQHPNIIKIRGHSLSGTAGFGTGLNTGYVLILDRLNETLSQRLKKWRGKNRPLVSKLLKLSSHGKKSGIEKENHSSRDKSLEGTLRI